jgi:hypothetical protein
LACSTLVLKRSEDSGRKLGGTATIGQLEQRVQVIAGVASESVGEVGGAAGAAKAFGPPRNDAIRIG